MNGDRLRRQTLLILLFAATVAVLTAGLMVALTAPIRPLEAPADWVLDTYQPVKGCPGDRIDYQLVLQVKRSGHLYVYNSFVRGYNHPDVIAARESELGQHMMAETGLQIIGDTIQGQRLGSGFGTVIVLEDENGVPIDVGLIVDQDAGFVIPDFGPGEYSRNIAAGITGVSAFTTIRSQRFTIRDDCE